MNENTPAAAGVFSAGRGLVLELHVCRAEESQSLTVADDGACVLAVATTVRFFVDVKCNHQRAAGLIAVPHVNPTKEREIIPRKSAAWDDHDVDFQHLVSPMSRQHLFAAAGMGDAELIRVLGQPFDEAI